MSLIIRSTISWFNTDTFREEKVIVEIHTCESITINGVELREFLAQTIKKTPDIRYIVSKAPYTIGRALINPLKHSVSFNDQEKHLGPMAFKTLDFLCKCENNRAEKDVIVREVWKVKETCMAMYSLNNCVCQLRKVLTEESGITIDSEVRGYLRLIEHT